MPCQQNTRTILASIVSMMMIQKNYNSFAISERKASQQYAHAAIRKCDYWSTSKYVQRVHKRSNTVRRQIQLGSFLIFGQ
jgi:hypothetical protein